jgi:uncharacterized phage protein (TIGR02218 family)
MRTPTWESSPGALATFLNSAVQCTMADLYTFTLTGGAVLRYTGADVPVTIAGVTYGVGPVISRGKTKLSVGINVDTLSLTIAADKTVTINAVPILQFAVNGGFDGATLQLQRAFASAPAAFGTAWVGTLGLFNGRVNEVTPSRYSAALTISSDSELMNTMVPRNVYQPGCTNTLFDSTCGLPKALYAQAKTATSASDVSKTRFTLNSASAALAQGFAVCNTGANAGVQRTIKTVSGNSIQTIQPWPQAVAAGDTFTVYPGCDKQMSTCQSRFGNLLRFRGQPFVPAPESIT